MKPIVAVKEIRKPYSKHINADERKSLIYDKEIVLENLSEIEDSAMAFETSLKYLQFVDRIILKNKEMEVLRKDPSIDPVHLMTIHMSKGLEFPGVYLIGGIEDIVPHRSALQANESSDIFVNVKPRDKFLKAVEEERRFIYVVIMGVKDDLNISSPVYYRNNNAKVLCFLLEPYFFQSIFPTIVLRSDIIIVESPLNKRN